MMLNKTNQSDIHSDNEIGLYFHTIYQYGCLSLEPIADRCGRFFTDTVDICEIRN